MTTEDTPVSERKWTKGPEWVLGIMGTDAADAHAYRRDIDADRGRGAMEDSVNARAVVSIIYEALADLLSKVERDQCHHEATHRGGAIWTFCDDCGQKWADDEGGFVPYVEPSHIAKARAALQRAEGEET